MQFMSSELPCLIGLFRTFIGEPILFDPKLSCDELAGKVSSVFIFVTVTRVKL